MGALHLEVQLLERRDDRLDPGDAGAAFDEAGDQAGEPVEVLQRGVDRAVPGGVDDAVEFRERLS